MGTLPGLGRSQEAQETRIAGLEEELKAVEVGEEGCVGRKGRRRLRCLRGSLGV